MTNTPEAHFETQVVRPQGRRQGVAGQPTSSIDLANPSRACFITAFLAATAAARYDVGAR